MSCPESGGPSTSTMRWTLYVVLLVVTVAAMYILFSGHELASAGAVTLLCTVISNLRKITKP
jgi:tryptophan-rich sensory protein